MVTVDDEHGSIPLEDVFGGRGVPEAVVVAVVPVGAVVLYFVSENSISTVERRGYTSCWANHNSSVLIFASAMKLPSWLTRALNLRPRSLPWIQLIMNPP